MAQRRHKIAVIITAWMLIVVSYYFGTRLNRPQMAGEAVILNVPHSQEAGISESKTVSPQVSAGVGEVDRNAVSAWAPDQQTVREEVRQDPHSSPQSLVSFSEKLGLRMEKALKSSPEAEKLLGELRGCVREDSLATAARALCLSSGERLGSWHPSLQEKVQAMRDEAPPSVVQLVDVTAIE